MILFFSVFGNTISTIFFSSEVAANLEDEDETESNKKKKKKRKKNTITSENEDSENINEKCEY